MAGQLFLTPVLEALDLGPSIDLPAAALREAAPAWLDPRYPAADRALRYGRGRGGLPYEEIAERTLAASPIPPAVSIKTRATARRERERDAAHRRDPDVDALIEQIAELRHRALDLPTESGSLDWAGSEDSITVYVGQQEGPAQPWTFSLAHPPGLIARDTVEAPAATLVTSSQSLSLPGVFWLPFTVLLEKGAFPKFQDARDRLHPSTEISGVHLFVSHRWLARAEPDPEAVQARFFAWQLFAAVCEAVEIAADRGLSTARRVSRLFGTPVGRFGGDLAESLFVNLLQPNLDEAAVAAVMAEVASSDPDLDDRGSAMADRDHGLQVLRERLKVMPQVRRLLDRVLVWFDYSCLPQPPRAEADELLFRDGLAHLNAVQLVGGTAILLDEVDDYLGRAWCVLEAITAESLTTLTSMPAVHLAGSRRSTNRKGTAEVYNKLLLRDSQHLVWRALLDTELSADQPPDRCLERLRLDVTDPADLPFVYEALRRMQAPDPPTDDTEIVTGFFPLPLAADGASLYWRTGSDRYVADEPSPSTTVDVDWTSALRLPELREAEKERRPLGVPPLLNLLESQDALLDAPGYEGVHLAIVGSCEGEAMLMARWARDHRDQIESLTARRTVSISWLATDILPVGKMAFGRLQPWPSLSRQWIIISTAHRLAHCHVTGHLLETMRSLGRPHGELAIDSGRQNLRWFEAHDIEESPRQLARYPIVEGVLRTHPGGIYRGALLPFLLPLHGRAAE
ncbi:hypothetical protein [Pedococcus sp. 5OH_020]|uniref:hypothetical protein n=1 Tax=Pedococcus sp. 5OH_020 TaxID=2989814 RepID=UPI0022E9EF6B|nr:hypothetical protein [Pedococcus sp. 5OH_020]